MGYSSRKYDFGEMNYFQEHEVISMVSHLANGLSVVIHEVDKVQPRYVFPDFGHCTAPFHTFIVTGPRPYLLNGQYGEQLFHMDICQN